MKVRHKSKPPFFALLCFFLSAALVALAVAVGVTAYLSGSDLVQNATLRRGLSEYFQKSARFITQEDLASVKALRLDDSSVSIGGAEILTGLKKNNALEVTDTASILDLDSYFHTIEFSEPIVDFSLVSLFGELEYLSVYEAPALYSLEQVAVFEDLYELEVWSHASQETDLSDLEGLEKLEVLTVANASLTDLSALRAHPTVTRLNLAGNEISDLSALSSLSSLRVLSLPTNNVRDLTPLCELADLEYLDLSDNEVKELAPLEELTSLKQLSLSNSAANTEQVTQNEIKDLTAVGKLTNLEFFYADHNPVSDLSPLASLTELAALSLNSCDISDVEPLSKLVKLQYVSLTDNCITDVSPLSSLPKLTHVLLAGNEELQDLTALEERDGIYVDLLRSA